MTKQVTNWLNTFENLALLYFTGKKRLVEKTVWGSKNQNFGQRPPPKGGK